MRKPVGWRRWYDILKDEGFKLRTTDTNTYPITPNGKKISGPDLLVKAGVLIKLKRKKAALYFIWNYETFDDIIDGLKEN